MKKISTLCAALLFLCAIGHGQETRPAGNTGSGLFIKKGKIYDANGCLFTPRGINTNHGWLDKNDGNRPMYDALDEVSSFGFNTARLTWGDGELGGAHVPSWGAELQDELYEDIIQKCIAVDMVPMITLHNGTGSNSTDLLQGMVSWYVDNASWLLQFDEHLLLNIANEWGRHNLEKSVWRETYRTAITRIRDAGYECPIIIDGREWSKNIDVIKDYGQEMIDFDPQHNIGFGVHYYCGNGENGDVIRSEMKWAKDNEIALIVGEFTDVNRQGCDGDEEAVVDACQQYEQGFYYWAWFNGGLSVATTLNADTYDELTPEGKWLIFDGEHNIKSTSFRASNLGGTNCAGSGSDDEVISVSSPQSVEQGETVSVTVTYSASQTRDLTVAFQKDSSPFNTYRNVIKSVGAGTNDTETFEIAIPNTVPIANDGYQFQVFITPTGQGWSNHISNIAKKDVDCTEGTSPPSGGNTIKVRAKGDCGTETMQLRVNNNVVKTWNNVGTSYSNYSYDDFTSGTVSVHFTNNGSSAGCNDRNLSVDYIEVCGTLLQTETVATETSTWDGPDDEKLYTNGDFDYGNRNCGTQSSSSGTVTVRARGRIGGERFELLIGGQRFGSQKQVGTGYSNYVFNDIPAGNKNIKVDYVNDNGSGRDLRIDYIKVDNTTIQAESRGVNTGVWQNNSCGGSNSEWLHCNGHIDFGRRNIGNTSTSLKATMPTFEEPVEIGVYPNPVSDGLIQVSSEHDFEVRLFDMSGIEVYASEPSKAGLRSFDIESVSPGIYIIQIIDSTSGETKVSKLIVQ